MKITLFGIISVYYELYSIIMLISNLRFQLLRLLGGPDMDSVINQKSGNKPEGTEGKRDTCHT